MSEDQPQRKWIHSAWSPDGLPTKVHLGIRREKQWGKLVGKFMTSFYVTACSGRKLGGPFGQGEHAEIPEGHEVCRRCKAIRDREQDTVRQEQDTKPDENPATT